MQHVLGVIPARGGSKGIPQKNLAPLAGKPLLSYTCAAAIESRRLTRVVLSTDDAAIAESGRSYGVDVPFVRPAELSRDDTPMLPVLQHAVRAHEEERGTTIDAVVLLQPTSPLRRAAHIDEAVDLLERTGADSVVTVVEVPHQFNPVSLQRLEQGRLLPFTPGMSISRRQDKPLVYARNGPAVIAVRRSVLFDKNSLYGDDSRPIIMTPEESLDIDSPWDLELVEFVLGRRSASSAARRP